MKYFKVKYVEKVSSPNYRAMYRRTETYLAKDSVAVYEDLNRRFGDKVVSIDMAELDEKRVKPNTNVCIAI